MSQANCGFEDGDTVSARNLLIRLGPSLKVDIGFDPDYDLAKPRRQPKLVMKDVRALIDTGASVSCIDSGVAMDMQLMHLAQIHAPDLQFTFYGAFAGVDLAAGGERHTALVGRDFLSHFHMTYDGSTGQVTLIDPNVPLNADLWPDE